MPTEVTRYKNKIFHKGALSNTYPRAEVSFERSLGGVERTETQFVVIGERFLC